MAELTLDIARKILDAALAKGVEKKLKPLVVTILDARGCVKITAAQDGTSLMRGRDRAWQGLWRARDGHGIARAVPARAGAGLFHRRGEHAGAGPLVPVPGGVLIQDGGVLLGAVGVSGDTSDNDETCAVAGIEAAGLKANAGKLTRFQLSSLRMQGRQLKLFPRP